MGDIMAMMMVLCGVSVRESDCCWADWVEEEAADVVVVV